jgi:hypothetical protein
MQKHVIKHSMNQGRAGFSVDSVISGSRDGFANKGPLEEAAETFIEAAGSGNVRVVADLLHHGKVYVDVADKSGYTSLLAAAVSLCPGSSVWGKVLPMSQSTVKLSPTDHIFRLGQVWREPHVEFASFLGWLSNFMYTCDCKVSKFTFLLEFMI